MESGVFNGFKYRYIKVLKSYLLSWLTHKLAILSFAADKKERLILKHLSFFKQIHKTTSIKMVRVAFHNYLLKFFE